MENYELLFAVIIVLTIYLLFNFPSNCDEFSNRSLFSVLKKYDNKDNAKHILQTIDRNLLALINKFNYKYSNIDSLNASNKKKKLLKFIKHKLNKTYKSSSLQENFPKIAGKEVSYNVDKGNVISLCLRHYDNPEKFHDMNDLMFVAIHEVAHSCNESYGHDTKFWKVFRILLEVAVENNLYKNINYQNMNKNYCSMAISYSPMFDTSLDDEYYFR
jgi:predicted metal-dependent hydrolase